MTAENAVQKRVSRLRETTINTADGSGGKKMRDLIEDVFLGAFNNPLLAPLEDQAVMNLAGLAAKGDRLAFTTDSYVVSPLFFPGGNIGALAVNGTVNDLAMCGALPLYLSCGMVLEEGLSVDTLRQVAATMRETADAAGVAIVTGDTKVVERGAADKLFINTSGVGVIPAGVNISATRAQLGDKIIINGYLGDHGSPSCFRVTSLLSKPISKPIASRCMVWSKQCSLRVPIFIVCATRRAAVWARF